MEVWRGLAAKGELHFTFSAGDSAAIQAFGMKRWLFLENSDIHSGKWNDFLPDFQPEVLIGRICLKIGQDLLQLLAVTFPQKGLFFEMNI